MTGTVAVPALASGTALCRLEDLPNGAARGFDPGKTGSPVLFLVRQGDRIHAYRDLCPHYGTTTLAWRRDAYLTADGGMIACSAHGALFRIEDGVCIVGPCINQRLSAIPGQVHDGMILAAWKPGTPV